jgi:Putative beta-barrel porin 2
MTSVRNKLALASLLHLMMGSVAIAQTASQQGTQSVGSASMSGQGQVDGIRADADNEHGGIRLSESASLHVGLGTETGYDTNVFYDKVNLVAAPVVRLVPAFKLTNGHDWDDGHNPQTYYRLGAQLLYRQYISDDERVTKQNAFNPTVDGVIRFGSSERSNVEISDRFGRYLEAPYGPSSDNIDRIENMATIRLSLVPGGGRFEFKLGYTNVINRFLTEQLKFANNMAHDVTLDMSWKWFPKTSVFAQVSQGFVGYSRDQVNTMAPREDSFPLRTLAGLRGLLTDKLAVNLGVGYANAFYQGAAAQSTGFDNLATAVEFSYAPSEFGETILGYRHEIRNSPVIGDFYTVDSPYLNVRWLVGQRLNITAFGRYEARSFKGRNLARNDNFIQSGVTVDLFITKWLYAGGNYTNTINRSDSGVPGNPNAPGFDYAKHVILFRLGLTY